MFHGVLDLDRYLKHLQSQNRNIIRGGQTDARTHETIIPTGADGNRG